MPAARPLPAAEIDTALATLPGWSSEDDRLTRLYRLPNHLAAAAFVLHIASVQEAMDHHADLTLGYNTVEVATHTHSAGGRITALDVTLARRVEDLSAAHGVRG
ncbi:pterin-4-alpha-carbinolamine dehydratase [Streptomyces sp. TverLS-915]|uniref:4a-hydroxytetrahydrobiopterin dehydratase n=1 Tax=unclassified Streptomyces TaxID=2593676 RepID=UPI00081DB1FF|nr:4a-hydroxytetrahydrobiopterin dehydratase [Streptomyces sp. TverLS-915]SCD30792.1 pterin-4-alpha-carbinolamine dehydratase [Streptomyces sp. TverLS-915]